MRYLLERWSDLSYRDKGFFLVAIPAAALLIVACAAYVLTSQGSSAGRSAYSEFRTLAALERMKTSETSASAAIQGFFLTREQHYVLTERKAITQFDANRQEALALTAGNRSQQQRLELTGAIQLSREERIFAALARFRSGRLDPQALGAIVLADEGERLRIEKVIDGMQAEDARLHDADHRSLSVPGALGRDSHASVGCFRVHCPDRDA
jgi:CHASE3 domain sensor protein